MQFKKYPGLRSGVDTYFACEKWLDLSIDFVPSPYPERLGEYPNKVIIENKNQDGGRVVIAYKSKWGGKVVKDKEAYERFNQREKDYAESIIEIGKRVPFYDLEMLIERGEVFILAKGYID